jgi:rubrerythrin
MDEITVIETEFGNIYTCDNCGATAESAAAIQHHPSCKPGESKFWEKFYEEAHKEEGGD